MNAFKPLRSLQSPAQQQIRNNFTSLVLKYSVVTVMDVCGCVHGHRKPWLLEPPKNNPIKRPLLPKLKAGVQAQIRIRQAEPEAEAEAGVSGQRVCVSFSLAVLHMTQSWMKPQAVRAVLQFPNSPVVQSITSIIQFAIY